jgi:hypothetical protein
MGWSAVAALASNDVWVIGQSAPSDPAHFRTIHWNGAGWTEVRAPRPGQYSALYDVAAISPDNLWSVGTIVERYNDAAAFSDVPPGNTFYESVRCLACRGILNGYSDGTFRPNNNITRGQIAKVVSNAAGFSDPPAGQTFEDVPPNQTFYEWVERLATRGHMSGYACGSPGEPCVPPLNRPYFRPGNNATRGQLTKIVSNAAGFGNQPTGQTFEDVPPSQTFWLYVERLLLNRPGVMGGYQCGGPGEPCVPPANRPYFRPANNVTRGQGAKIIANTFFPSCQFPPPR